MNGPMGMGKCSNPAQVVGAQGHEVPKVVESTKDGSPRTRRGVANLQG